MADKAATVYVVDLGASMRDKRNGRNETDLDFALKYVWDRILTTVRSKSPQLDTRRPLTTVRFRTVGRQIRLAWSGFARTVREETLPMARS